MKRFPYNAVLFILAIVMLLAYFAAGLRARPEEYGVWDTIRDGQRAIWTAQENSGVGLSREADRLKTGFIGVEWSPLTTTLGSLEAKRTSANPLWALRFIDWFDELGMRKGDRVVIYSSASFPAALFSAIAAAEARGLEIMLSVSLGSSTWGANREEFPWPLMEKTLREGGFIKARASFYTPGGARETGREFTRETLALLERLSEESGIPLVMTETLDEMIRYKSLRLTEFGPKLLISIGGSNANLGDSPDAAEIPNGLLLPKKTESFVTGGGVIAEALRAGIPVVNMLGFRKLALEAGIPWDAGVFARRGHRPGLFASLFGLAVFCAVMVKYKRWTWGA